MLPKDEPINSHVNDVELTSGYNQLVKVLKTVTFKPGALSEEEYLERTKEGIFYFCKFNDFDYEWHFKNSMPLVVNSNLHAYPFYLGWMLISFDIPRINSFLEHQKKYYVGPHDFVNVVEFVAYPCVQNNSPFINDTRLEKIMQWVDKKKEIAEAENIVSTKAKVDQDNLLPTQYRSLLTLKDSISQNDLAKFFEVMQSFFASMSYNMKVTEAYFHGYVHLILTILDFKINSEVETNIGRIDSVVETENYIHIIEFKIANCEVALKQILDNKYYQQYLRSNKKIILVGVELDKETRNITNWKHLVYK
jgi:hypothetical protein